MNRTKWDHQPGDRYSVVACMFVGNECAGFVQTYQFIAGPFAHWAVAWRRGVVALGHDDFNLAVVRNGALVAMLWDDELIEYSQAELREVARDVVEVGP